MPNPVQDGHPLPPPPAVDRSNDGHGPKVLRDLFASKKFTVAFIATLVWAVSLLGFNASAETVGAILSPLYMYVIGQGVADVGKAKPAGGA